MAITQFSWPPSAPVTFPASAATAANQVLEIAELTDINTNTASIDVSAASIDAKLPALSGGSVPVVGPLTDAQLRASPLSVDTGLSPGLTDAELRASPVPVSGTIDTGLTQPLTDVELRATAVPVSGPLTDAELRATAVPISGTVTANTGLSQPLTDTQLRATAVPVSGPLTDTQLRATAVPVSVTANPGRNSVVYTRLDYTSAPVTTGAFYEIVTSMPSDVNQIEIFDSSGRTLSLAFGASPSEVVQLYIFPGGNGVINLHIPASTRVSLKAVSGNATVGEFCANFYS